MTILEGIDVSNHNGVINWSEVAQAGKSFAGIKATEGLNYQDPYFYNNWVQSKHQGIRRIAYHFLHPALSGREQAEYFHQYVHDHGKFHPGDVVMLDVEVGDNVPPAQVVECCEDFVVNILRETHCGVYIYTASFFWIGYLNNPVSDALAMCPLWQASYGSEPLPLKNWPKGYTIWQYSASASVPGISGSVDLNRFYGNGAAFDLLATKGGRS